MLRAITFNIGALSSTFLGVVLLAGSVFVLIFVPWLDCSKICPARYRPIYNFFGGVNYRCCFYLVGLVHKKSVTEPFYRRNWLQHIILYSF
ncbi:hypothetical protein [Bartonella refiksaydamii]|uniref:hypothetical protein n=1 Tax=Bartonella refiksaydamii TaxID=2654951 RepID=UPI0012EB1CB5